MFTPDSSCPPAQRHCGFLFPRLLLAFLIAAIVGCQSPQSPPASEGPAVRTDAPVSNLYQPGSLPPEVRRVVLLPVHFNAYLEETHDYLDALWAQAIQRQNRFETILIDRQTIADWSDQEQWPSTVAIPQQLRERIESIYAPDAILLCDITRLESYRPLEIGLRVKLFSWDDGSFLWGVDGVWTRHPDGTVESSPRGLGSIFKNSRKNSEKTVDLAAISPRYFYYHLVESVALTLPERPIP